MASKIIYDTDIGWMNDDCMAAIFALKSPTCGEVSGDDNSQTYAVHTDRAVDFEKETFR